MGLKNYERVINYWQAANEYEWSNSRSKAQGNGVKIALNTYLFEEGKGYRIEYHGNTIVRYTKDGEIFLYTQGWYTSTTKERLNIFTPNNIYVSQKRGNWYVKQYNGEVVEFYEGIEVNV